MARKTKVHFWKSPRDGSVTPRKDKIKGAKPSMVGRFCSFFGVGTPESTGDLVISSITTEVRGASVLIPGGTLQWRSCNYFVPIFP